MSFEHNPLPYSGDALSPHISAETLSFHHGKHHSGYVKKLNGMIGGTPYAEKSLTEIIKSADGGIFNNAAQIYNHDFYWNSMSPNGGGEPSGELLQAINSAFNSVDGFKEQFKKVGLGRFGSGYVWLVLDGLTLKIVDSVNAGNPMTDGQVPILTADLWEHSYYVDYRNDRGSYLDAFLSKLINWDFAAQNLAKASS